MNKEEWEKFKEKCPWKVTHDWETFSCKANCDCSYNKCAPVFWMNKMLDNLVKDLKCLTTQ